MSPRDPKSGTGQGARQSGIRWDRIAALREEIRRGAYDDPAKWEKILDRLAKDLRAKG